MKLQLQRQAYNHSKLYQTANLADIGKPTLNSFHQADVRNLSLNRLPHLFLDLLEQVDSASTRCSCSCHLYTEQQSICELSYPWQLAAVAILVTFQLLGYVQC